ncbi:PAN domain-containing protein [Cardamine amara subsp. amara]|uniref:PAN domain-containing protein n=1 Tax=Cardamine amara subsp. amara TaxID=228776 RepID=A0ABD1A001_CARAN
MESFCSNSFSSRLLLLFVFFVLSQRVNAGEPVLELVKGFEAKPDSSVVSFQPLLTDPSGNFSLGFLRLNGSRLSLAVTHPNLTDPLWVFDPTRSASWSHKTKLFFNGSLVISDPSSRVEWSTHTNGDRVIIRNDSNLLVVKTTSSVEWESFDFPGNTLVENQNFTSAMALVSSNGQYSMRLGSDFIGLYAKVNEDSQQFYWKHSALQAKAKIKDGSGPILARINPNGYIGMYQIGNIPVDVEAFNSFQKPVSGLLILRLEPDGNLRGYLWDGTHWALNYEAIRETCDLPNPCGPYSLCTPGSGCSCIDNATVIGECIHANSESPVDFCGKTAEFKVVRRGGVEVPFKELMDHKTTSSLGECEEMCVESCKCFGAVYNNGSGFCYLVDYPIRTMLGVADASKVGYFKVREGVGKKKSRVGLTVGMSLLAVIALVLMVAMVFVWFRSWSREKRVLEEDNGLSPGPYKNLGSDSFRSVEMSRR